MLISFNRYYNCIDLINKRDVTCLDIFRQLFSFYKESSNVDNLISIFNSIVSNITQCDMNKMNIERELDIVQNAICADFNSPEKIVLFTDSEGKFMAVNEGFCKTYNYEPNQILNKFVGCFTDFIWFEKSLINPYTKIPERFPGEHINFGKTSKKKKIPFIGASWAISDNNNKFLGAWAVLQRLEKSQPINEKIVGINLTQIGLAT